MGRKNAGAADELRPYQKLAGAVLAVAVSELRGINALAAIDAALYLAGPGGELAELAGLDVQDDNFLLTVLREVQK